MEDAGVLADSFDPRVRDPSTQQWRERARVDFSRYIFDDPADFGSFIFPGSVNFEGANFNSAALFAKATFYGQVNFFAALFQSHADFRSARFLFHSRFEVVSFLGNSTFEGAVFGGDVAFAGARFEGTANFSKVVVSGSVRFPSTQFYDDVTFDQSSFDDYADFGQVTFLDSASFAAVQFRHLDLDSFSQAELHKANLSTAFGLSQASIEAAFGSESTKLPPDLVHPTHWLDSENGGSPLGPSASSGAGNASTNRSRSSLRTTPPAKFGWKEGRLHPELIPLPPERRGIGLRRDVNVAARDGHLQAVARLADELVAALGSYRDANRQSLVKDISEPLKQIAREACKPGNLVVASYLRAKIAVVEEAASSAEAEALDGVDRIELQQFIGEGKKLLPFFPELLEIDSPYGSALIPEEMAVQADGYADKVVELAESNSGRELFSDEAIDVLRTERDFAPARRMGLSVSPEDRIAYEREKLARFGGLIGAIKEALENAPKSVHALGSFASIAAGVKDLWNVVRQFLGM